MYDSMYPINHDISVISEGLYVLKIRIHRWAVNFLSLLIE